jgi:P pilus assembly chaperone PapD
MPTLETSTSTLVKHLLEQNKMKPATPAQANAVDASLAGLALTLKTFTPYYLNLAKTKIFSAIKEYEMAMIIGKKMQVSTPSGYGW